MRLPFEISRIAWIEYDTDDRGEPVILGSEVSESLDLTGPEKRDALELIRKDIVREREARRSEPQGETVPYFRAR